MPCCWKPQGTKSSGQCKCCSGKWAPCRLLLTCYMQVAQATGVWCRWPLASLQHSQGRWVWRADTELLLYNFFKFLWISFAKWTVPPEAKDALVRGCSEAGSPLNVDHITCTSQSASTALGAWAHTGVSTCHAPHSTEHCSEHWTPLCPAWGLKWGDG